MPISEFQNAVLRPRNDGLLADNSQTYEPA